MSLPVKAVDRLFTRLSLTYGRDFDAEIKGNNIADVKTNWAHELSAFGERLSAVAWALENLPERCPNVIQFRNLCRAAPVADAPRLPEPKADPERMRAELAKLAPMRTASAAANLTTPDSKAWAKRLIDRHAAGDLISNIGIRMARQVVVGLPCSDRTKDALGINSNLSAA